MNINVVKEDSNLSNKEIGLEKFDKFAEKSFEEIWDNDLDERWNKY